METQFDELMTVSEIAACLKVPVSWVSDRNAAFRNRADPAREVGEISAFFKSGSKNVVASTTGGLNCIP